MALKLAVPSSNSVPPPALALLSEGPRAAWGLGRLIREWKTLEDVPPGDGRPVILLPGLTNSDRSNFVMRRYLNRLGYRAEGWDLGRNLGVRAIGPEGERLMERIAAVHAETGEKVTLVGISLGGIMARDRSAPASRAGARSDHDQLALRRAADLHQCLAPLRMADRREDRRSGAERAAGGSGAAVARAVDCDLEP